MTLACIAGLHLLALLGWTQQQRMSTLAQPRLVSMWLLPALRPRPTASPRRERIVDKAPHVAPVIRPPVARPVAPAAPALPAAPPALTAAAAAPAPAPAPASAPGGQADPGFDIDLARRQARRLAQDSDADGAHTLSEANTPWTRLRSALDAAHVAPVTGVQWESYTSPDGTIIYRERVGGRIVCHRSGNVARNDIGSTGGVDSAGYVTCPSHAQWQAAP